MPSSSSRSSFTARRFRRSARSSSLLGSVATIEDVMDLLIVTEAAYVLRLDVALKHVAAADASAELQPIRDRLRKIRDFHLDLVLPMLRRSSADAVERFFAEQDHELAALYRAFLELEVSATVAGLVVQLRPSLRVVDEQLAAYGLLFAALHRVSPAGRRVEVLSASSESESASLRVEVEPSSVHRLGLGSDAPVTRKPTKLGKLYKLKNQWKKIAHADCEKDLGMTIPQIMKVEGSCAYVLVGFGWRSLGQDGIDMLRRASVLQGPGNPTMGAPNRRIAGTLLELLVSTVPTSVMAFRDAVSAKEMSTGTDPLDVLVKVLESLKPDDQERFTIMTDRAFVCPHCGRHEIVRDSRQLFFYYHRADYDYTQPWSNMCGLPFDDFGPTLKLAAAQKAKCKNPDCKKVLRSALQDGKLQLKEKLKYPVRRGTPEKPQYVVVNYKCPPPVIKNGKLEVNREKFETMQVRPFLEQRFGAYRVSPNARVRSARAPPAVFNTDNQEVFHLLGYGVIIPKFFSHGAWRTHNLDATPRRFIHFEARSDDCEYFRLGEEDYLRAGQQVALAIYKSTGERAAEQPTDHEDEWAKHEHGYATHDEGVRKAPEAPPRVKTRSQAASTMAQNIGEPGPSGTQQQASTAEQPGTSGTQQAATVDLIEQLGSLTVQQRAQEKTAKSGKK